MENNNESHVQYHRKCYQYFTMKKSLERLMKQKTDIQTAISRNTDGSIDTEETVIQHRNKRGKSSSTILPKRCIFCEKEKKYKGMQSKEPLRLCIDERATATIISVATKKKYYRILSITDLIASEARYHSTCYKQYTKVNNNQKNVPTNYQEAEQAALNDFGNFVFHLQNNPRIEQYSTAAKMIESEFENRGVEMNLSTKKNLRRKLEKTFPNITFVNVEGRLYFYPKTYKFEQLIIDFIVVNNKYQKISQQLNQYSENDEKVVNSSKIIKNEIKKLKDTMPWPPQSTRLASWTISHTTITKYNARYHTQ